MSNEFLEPSMQTGSSPVATPALAYADISTPRPEHIGMAAGITRGDVAVITIRILGIYIILQGLTELGFLAASFMGYGYGISRINVPFATVFALFEAVGVLMLIKAPWIARRLLPEAPATPTVNPGPGSPIELQSAAFAVIGVLVTVWAIPDVALAIWRYTNPAILTAPHEQGGMVLVESLLKPAVELVLGVWLFFGSKRLSLYWQKMRGPRAVRDGDTDGDAGPL